MNSDLSIINRIITQYIAPDHVLHIICRLPLSDARFVESPASTDSHHCYPGGLVYHTREVLCLCIEAAKVADVSIDLPVLVTAAIWHDYGKVWDYEADPTSESGYRRTDHCLRIRHLSKSYGLFMVQASKGGLSDVVTDAVGHCILSHHGTREWGSPVKPVSREAWILHTSDQLSARLGDIDS